MDWIPTLEPEALTLSDSHAAPPGRLLYFRLRGRTRTFLTFGNDGRSTHWLSFEADEPYRVFNAEQARPANTLVLDVSDRVRLAVRTGPPEVDRMVEPYGCVGISTVGPILCGRQHEVNFGGDTAVYLNLSSWRHLAVDHQAWFNGVAWFSNWELAYFDNEVRERHRLIGSPNWNGNG